MKETNNETDSMVIGGVQLFLAGKRTLLSVLRTGNSVLILTLSVLSVLIGEIKHYEKWIIIALISIGVAVWFIYKWRDKRNIIQRKIPK